MTYTLINLFNLFFYHVQCTGYRWVAADWFPVWCYQLSELAGPLWWPSASPARHQAIASSPHRETHTGCCASLWALCRIWWVSISTAYLIQTTLLKKKKTQNILFICIFRRKMAAPQRTHQNKRKNMGGASNWTLQWDFQEGGVWGGSCDTVAIPLWRRHV